MTDEWIHLPAEHRLPRYSIIIQLFGITEADIRDITPVPMFDIYRIRTWNWRTFWLSGIEEHTGVIDPTIGGINWAEMFPRRRGVWKWLRRK